MCQFLACSPQHHLPDVHVVDVHGFRGTRVMGMLYASYEATMAPTLLYGSLISSENKMGHGGFCEFHLGTLCGGVFFSGKNAVLQVPKKYFMNIFTAIPLVSHLATPHGMH
jgi:hypothetical protein